MRTWFAIVFVFVLTAGAGLVPVRAQGGLLVEGPVFVDLDGDGERQAEEPGIAGVTVTVGPLGDPAPRPAVTDLLGYYLVQDLVPGTVLVQAEPPAGYLCIRCAAQIDLAADPPVAVDLALILVTPWTPTPSPTPTNTPTETPSPSPTPTESPLPTDTATPWPTRTPAPTATPGNPVITFYASPDTVRPPGCTSLYWWVDRATEVFLILPGGQMGVEGSGQRQVCPQSTTTYRLKVNGANGRQEIVDAQVIALPPPTNTPAPPPRVKPTRQALPSATATPTPDITFTATPTPTLTAVPTGTPLPTATPAVDPLLAGLPVRWGTIGPRVPAATTDTTEHR